MSNEQDEYLYNDENNFKLPERPPEWDIRDMGDEIVNKVDKRNPHLIFSPTSDNGRFLHMLAEDYLDSTHNETFEVEEKVLTDLKVKEFFDPHNVKHQVLLLGQFLQSFTHYAYMGDYDMSQLSEQSMVVFGAINQVRKRHHLVPNESHVPFLFLLMSRTFRNEYSQVFNAIPLKNLREAYAISDEAYAYLMEIMQLVAEGTNKNFSEYKSKIDSAVNFQRHDKKVRSSRDIGYTTVYLTPVQYEMGQFFLRYSYDLYRKAGINPWGPRVGPGSFDRGEMDEIYNYCIEYAQTHEEWPLGEVYYDESQERFFYGDSEGRIVEDVRGRVTIEPLSSY